MKKIFIFVFVLFILTLASSCGKTDPKTTSLNTAEIGRPAVTADTSDSPVTSSPSSASPVSTGTPEMTVTPSVTGSEDYVFTPGEAYKTVDGRLSLVWDYTDLLGDDSEGDITLTLSDSAANATYLVYYADEDGYFGNILAIGSVTAEKTDTAYTVAHMHRLSSAPSGTKAIVAVEKQTKEIRAYFTIPANRIPEKGKKLETFAAVSDIHIFNNAAYNGDYNNENGESDMKRAIRHINAAKVDFTVVSGDLTLSFMDDTEGIESELRKSTDILKTLEKPFYVVKGNHDKKTNEDVWKEMTGCDTDYTVNVGEDVFLFMSLRTVNNVDSNDSAPYGSKKITWLSQELVKAKGKRVFLIMHYPFSGTAGLIPGNRYGFSTVTEENQIMSMINEHGNVIVFNGHTHFDFQSTVKYPDINVKRLWQMNTYTVHLPSVAYPRNYNNTEVTSESQGYIVEVYENGVLLKGMDFVTGRYMPSAIWYLDTATVTNSLSDEEAELPIGESTQIGFLNDIVSVSFRSLDASVASVDEKGNVTAVSEGETEIVCLADGFTYRFGIRVYDESKAMKGSGTIDDPYLIVSADHFAEILENVRDGEKYKGVYFAVTEDICLNDSDRYEPSGTSTGGTFAGFIDGRGHILSATMKKSSENFATPFFWYMTGTVINTVFEADMGGCVETSYMIARTMDGGTLGNCIVRGKLYANNSSTSIVAGTSEKTKLQNMFIDVSVSGTKPSSTKSGVSVKGTGSVSNIYYTENGCVEQFSEKKVTDVSGVDELLNGTLGVTAGSLGIDSSLLCTWTVTDGILCLEKK